MFTIHIFTAGGPGKGSYYRLYCTIRMSNMSILEIRVTTACPFYGDTSATFHAHLSNFPSALSYAAIKLYVFEKNAIHH